MEKRRDEDGRLVGQGRGRGLSVFLPGLLCLLAVIITKQEQQHGINSPNHSRRHPYLANPLWFSCDERAPFRTLHYLVCSNVVHNTNVMGLLVPNHGGLLVPTATPALGRSLAISR